MTFRFKCSDGVCMAICGRFMVKLLDWRVIVGHTRNWGKRGGTLRWFEFGFCRPAYHSFIME